MGEWHCGQVLKSPYLFEIHSEISMDKVICYLGCFTIMPRGAGGGRGVQVKHNDHEISHWRVTKGTGGCTVVLCVCTCLNVSTSY